MVAENRPGARPGLRRAQDAGLRHFGTNRASVDAEGSKETEPAKRWAAFLSDHREAIAAMDFFTVPTLTFGVLYGFFVIVHDRRRILHCNVTRHPTTAWVAQQIREAFPFDSAPRYLILDREHTFRVRRWRP